MPKRERRLIKVRAVVDESGSMGHVQNETVKGYDDFLAMLKETPADVRNSLTIFDNEYRHAYENEFLANAEGLTGKRAAYNANAGGGTALFDAFGDAIDREAQMSSEVDKVIMVVITDGEDNESRRFSGSAIRAKVKEKEATGRWEFIWLGPNRKTAADLGIKADNTYQLNAGREGIKAALAAVTEHVREVLLLEATAGPSSAGYTG